MQKRAEHFQLSQAGKKSNSGLYVKPTIRSLVQDDRWKPEMNHHIFKDHIDTGKVSFSADKWESPEIIQKVFRFETLYRSFRLIIFTFTACVAGGLLFIIFRPESYLATGSVIVGGNVTNAAAQREILQQEGELKALIDARDRLSARQARLQSELAGQNDINFPVDLLARSRVDAVLATIIDGERRLHQSKLDAYKSKLVGLERLLEFTKAEVSSLSEQLNYAAVQKTSIDNELDGVRSLARKGLATGTRLGDLERTAATFATRYIEIQSRVQQRGQDVIATMQKISDLANDTRSIALKELQDTNAEFKAADIRISAFVAPRFPATADLGAIANQIEIIKSYSTARDIVIRFQLQDDYRHYGQTFRERLSSSFRYVLDFIPGATVGSVGKRVVGPGSPEAVNIASNRVMALVGAERGPVGSRIDISFRSHSENQARNICNYLLEKFGTSKSADLRDQNVLEAGGNSQTVRPASVRMDGPSVLAIFASSVFAGLCLAIALAFAFRYVRLSLGRESI